jgi:DNA-binding LytR/AlgR family response regulator
VPPVIFTTAYDRFVLDAFRSHGIAYLLKPLRDADLAAAMTKYEDLRRAFAGASPLARLATRLAGRGAAAAAPVRRHVTVSVARKIHVVLLERVAAFRLGITGVDVTTVEGAIMAMTGSSSLGELEAWLPGEHYFRINRTEIVRLDAIDHIEPRKDRLWLAVRGVSGLLSVAVHRTAAFRRWLDPR